MFFNKPQRGRHAHSASPTTVEPTLDSHLAWLHSLQCTSAPPQSALPHRASAAAHGPTCTPACTSALYSSRNRPRAQTPAQGSACAPTRAPSSVLRHTPPPKPITPLDALNPQASEEQLWAWARNKPHLRPWIVANSHASPVLIDWIAQQGSRPVDKAVSALLSSLEAPKLPDTPAFGERNCRQEEDGLPPPG